MSAKPLVSIIIPSAADPSLLRACLRSLEENAPKTIPFETIVVLNRPTEHAAVLRDSPLTTNVVTSSINLGLAGAANRARTRASGEYLVLLHDDSEVEPGWMEALLEAAREHPEAGSIGGMVLDPNRRLQSAGMILWRDGTTSPPWIGARPSPSRFAKSRAVDYTGTSSLLIRAATWDATGGFDEQFYPVYYVDVDFSMAVRRLGQVVRYEPRSKTLHQQGGSGDMRWRQFITARNRERFLAKWRHDLEEYHEPPVTSSHAAIGRALARSTARAARIQAKREAAPRSIARSIDESDQDRRHLEMALALYSDYVADLRGAVDRAGEDIVQMHADRESRTKALQQTIAALEQDNAGLTNALAAAARDQASRNERMESLNAENIAFRQDLDAAANEESAQSDRITDLQNDAVALQRSVEESSRYRAALEGELSRLIAATRPLKQTLDRALEHHHALENEIALLRGRQEELTKLKSLRWWRVYDKVQPVLRLIAKIVRRRAPR